MLMRAPVFRRIALAVLLAIGTGGAIHAQGNAPSPPTSPLIGRWSESATCARSATMFVFTPGTFEIIDNGARGFLANVAYVQQGADHGVRVMGPPSTNRWGPRAPGLGDTYVFSYSLANRMITPVAIVRSDSRRDRLGADAPSFHRCR